jgi:WD40 repeat protein
LGFSFDGLLLASGGLDGIVNIWDTSSGVLKNKLEGPSEAVEVVLCLCFLLANHCYFQLYSKTNDIK